MPADPSIPYVCKPAASAAGCFLLDLSPQVTRSVELLFLGGTGQRGDAGLATLDHGGDIVEVTGADFLLVRHKGVAPVAGGEFGLLHALHVGGHATLHVVLREVEHVEPHAVDAGQRDELV